jgi:hypothetical protein
MAPTSRTSSKKNSTAESPKKGRKPLKPSSPNKGAAAKLKDDKNGDSKYRNRLKTFGVQTGESLFKLLCPRSDTKEAYIAGDDGIHANIEELMNDEHQSEKLCLQAWYWMCDPSNSDKPLWNKRTSSGNSPKQDHWHVYMYSHENTAKNNAEWRGKWGRNLVKVINAIEAKSTCQYKNGFIYANDTATEASAHLGDYLITEDTLTMFRNAHGEEFAEMMGDNDFVTSYFGPARVNHAQQMAARLFDIQVPDSVLQPDDILADMELESL